MLCKHEDLWSLCGKLGTVVTPVISELRAETRETEWQVSGSLQQASLAYMSKETLHLKQRADISAHTRVFLIPKTSYGDTLESKWSHNQGKCQRREGTFTKGLSPSTCSSRPAGTHRGAALLQFCESCPEPAVCQRWLSSPAP